MSPAMPVSNTDHCPFSVQYHRTVTFDALLGGAEDVLADLGVRQAMRVMPKDAKL